MGPFFKENNGNMVTVPINEDFTSLGKRVNLCFCSWDIKTSDEIKLYYKMVLFNFSRIPKFRTTEHFLNKLKNKMLCFPAFSKNYIIY